MDRNARDPRFRSRNGNDAGTRLKLHNYAPVPCIIRRPPRVRAFAMAVPERMWTRVHRSATTRTTAAMAHAVAPRIFAHVGAAVTAASKRWRADGDARAGFTAAWTGCGFIAFGDTAICFESAAVGAFVIVDRHGFYRAEDGMNDQFIKFEQATFRFAHSRICQKNIEWHLHC